MQNLYNLYNLKQASTEKLASFFSDSDSLFKGFEYAFNNQKLFEDTKNKNNILSKLKEEETSFSGINAKELIENGYGKNIDWKLFNSEKEKLNNFSAKLKENLQPISNQRKRKFSEHDGEYSFDRRDEIEPFQANYKIKSGLLPTLTVNVDFNFSAYQKAEAISQFGAFCFAVISKIEESGVNCEVNFVQSVSAFAETKIFKGKITRFTVNIKQSGSYVEESIIARCFTSGFYRRACFLFWCICAEKNKSKACDGLGYYQKMPTESQHGELNLSFENRLDAPEKTAERILKTLKGN